MKLYIFLFAALITIGIYSCNCKETCSYLDWKFTLEFRNLPDSITVKIKSYPKNSGFVNCRDSSTYTNFGKSYQSNGDSSPLLQLLGNDSTDYLVTASFNPQSGGIATNYYRLTEIEFQMLSTTDCSKTCHYHNLKNCRVNSVSTNSTGFGDIVLQ